MDLSLDYEKYLSLSKEEAFIFYKDKCDLKFFRAFLYTMLFIFGVICIEMIFGEFYSPVIASVKIASLISIIIILLFYKKIFNEKNLRKSILFLLPVFAIIFFVISLPEKISLTGIALFGGITVVSFKFSKNEILQLYGSLIVISTAVCIVFKGIGLRIEDYLFSSGFVIVFSFVAIFFENRRKKKFLNQYDIYSNKHSENIRRKNELDYAREIQLSMLPESRTIINDICISAISKPAYEVGGDYFDYFELSDGKVGVFICDVSGHGVASALLLSGLRSCMHLILEDTNNPREVFLKLNRMIRKTQNRKMFVTAVFAVFDSKNNTCNLFNAGHLPPFKISGASYELYKIKRHGITLGAMTIIEKTPGENEVTFDFQKGDKLILYTDGVVEAMEKDKNIYGFEKLERFLNEHLDKPAETIMYQLIEDINKFSKDEPQIDDITIVTVERK